MTAVALAAGGLWWGRESSVTVRDLNAIPLFMLFLVKVFFLVQQLSLSL